MSVDLKETVSGGFGALCCAYSGNPFDVVKIRLQTQVPGGSQHYTGVVDCVSKILKHEGFFALWKGVTPALSSALLENSVLFSMNGVLKRFYLSTLGDSGGYDGESSRPFTTAESAMLGGAGGFFSSTCITPLEVIKCRTQVEVGKATGPVTKFLSAYNQGGGLRGLFRGWSATTCRDVPFTFFFFGGYEAWTYMLLQSNSSLVCASTLAKYGNSDASHSDTSVSKLNAFGIYLAGGSAGAFAWGVAFPVDCVKSYMQTYQHPTSTQQGISFRQAIRHIYRERGGVQGFYRGWSAAVLRAFPANAGLFLGYELALDLLDRVVYFVNNLDGTHIAVKQCKREDYCCGV